MNTNNKTTSRANWSQLNKSIRNGVLQALYENIHHMRLHDYINILSVSHEWKQGLLKPSYIQKLKYIHQISTPLWQRFILAINNIDRSESPKFDEIHEMGDHIGGVWGGGLLPLVVPGDQITQAAYEVRELNKIRNHIISECGNYEHCQLQSFEDLNDEDRNELLDIV